jgi:hypothetical protein
MAALLHCLLQQSAPGWVSARGCVCSRESLLAGINDPSTSTHADRDRPRRHYTRAYRGCRVTFKASPPPQPSLCVSHHIVCAPFRKEKRKSARLPKSYARQCIQLCNLSASPIIKIGDDAARPPAHPLPPTQFNDATFYWCSFNPALPVRASELIYTPHT